MRKTIASNRILVVTCLSKMISHLRITLTSISLAFTLVACGGDGAGASSNSVAGSELPESSDGEITQETDDGIVLAFGSLFDVDPLDNPSWECISRERSATLPVAHIRTGGFRFTYEGDVSFTVAIDGNTYAINDASGPVAGEGGTTLLGDSIIGIGLYSQDGDDVVFGSTSIVNGQEVVDGILDGILRDITPISGTRFTASMTVSQFPAINIECILTQDGAPVVNSDAPGFTVHSLLTESNQLWNCTGPDTLDSDFTFEFFRENSEFPNRNSGVFWLVDSDTGLGFSYDMDYSVDVASGDIGLSWTGNTGGEFYFLMDDVDIISSEMFVIRDFIVVNPSSVEPGYESTCTFN